MSDVNIEAIGSNVRAIQERYLNDLHDEWNTFQYVLKELESWDGSSKVGSEVYGELSNQLASLKNNIEACKSLMSACGTYISEVQRANSGR